MEHEKPIINVLMVAFAAQGHINPMIRLGKTLQHKSNIHVTLATTEVFQHRLQSQSQSTATTTTTTTTSDDNISISGIDFEFFPDSFSLEYDRKSNLDTYMYTLAKVGPTNLYNLVISIASNKIKPKKFSCIIISPFVPWASTVAAHLGIPCAMLWIQPCTLFSIYHSFYNNLNDFPTKENPNLSVKLPSLPLLDTCDLPSFVLPTNNLMSMNEALSQAMKIVDNNIRWVLANTFYELEKDVIEHMSKIVDIKAVGPLVSPTLLQGEEHDQENDDHGGINLWKPDESCIDWLDKNEPNSVIYVSFGSLIELSKDQIENISNALMNCKRPFLWVVKENDHVIGEGVGQHFKDFLDKTKDKGIIVTWCPQNKVLLHKSIGCFITHCGWNSMLETISCGVPIIAYPLWTDQPTNAKLMTEVFGIGLRLWPNNHGLVGVEDIVKCIEEIMDGPRSVEIRAKAAEWKRVARDTVARGGSSDRNIQEFVDDVAGISSNFEYNVDEELASL